METKQRTPAETRDLALARFLDTLSSILEMVKPAIKKSVDEEVAKR